MTYYASPAAATARDNKSMTAEFGNVSYAMVQWAVPNAQAINTTTRIWRIPRGARVFAVEYGVAAIGNGTFDVGYERDGETDDADYFIDGAASAAGTFLSSLAQEPTALPRVFDEGGDTYITATNRVLTNVATGRIRIIIWYEWAGGK